MATRATDDSSDETCHRCYTPTDSPVPADVARQLGTSERHILLCQYAVTLNGKPARPPLEVDNYDADSWLLLTHTHLLDDHTYHSTVVLRSLCRRQDKNQE